MQVIQAAKISDLTLETLGITKKNSMLLQNLPYCYDF